MKLSATNTQRYSDFKIFVLFIVHCLCYNNNINKALAKGVDIMFDWNGNGEHDAFDDFVTFGLLEDTINENEEDEKPSARNRNRRILHRYDIYQDTNGARRNAITTFWLVLGLIILIVGFILIICNIKNQLLIALSILGLVFISYAVMSRGFDKDD